MPGRNDPCPCGSGRKYKRCCAGLEDPERAHRRLVESVTSWTVQEFPGEVEASLREFLGDREDPEDVEVNLAAAWFLQERELPGGGTPLERYADQGPDPGLRELAGRQAEAKLSLWRVLESKPGERLVVEPYRGGEALEIKSANVSRAVGRWDLLLGRVRPDVMELWGPVRSYGAGDEQAIDQTLERLAGEHGLDPEDTDEIVRRAPAALFSLERPEPVPLTTEGDAVRFATARWRVAPDAVRAVFEQAHGILSDGPDDGEESFGWIGSREKLMALRPEALPPGAVTIEASPVGMPDALSLGTFKLERDELHYEGISERRLEWARELIAGMLPDATFIHAEIEDFDEARKTYPKRPREREEIPPEALAEVRATMTERWLSEPIPALEGLTPRQAAQQPACVPQLRSLLRQLEASEAKVGDHYPIDVKAISAELGVTA